MSGCAWENVGVQEEGGLSLAWSLAVDQDGSGRTRVPSMVRQLETCLFEESF
jgi:hypothetical protein